MFPDRIWPNFELIQALIYVIVTYKYEKDLIAEKKCQRHFSHYKSMGIFSDAKGQLTLQSVVRSGLILSSHACYNYLQV